MHMGTLNPQLRAAARNAEVDFPLLESGAARSGGPEDGEANGLGTLCSSLRGTGPLLQTMLAAGVVLLSTGPFGVLLQTALAAGDVELLSIGLVLPIEMPGGMVMSPPRLAFVDRAPLLLELLRTSPEEARALPGPEAAHCGANRCSGSATEGLGRPATIGAAAPLPWPCAVESPGLLCSPSGCVSLAFLLLPSPLPADSLQSFGLRSFLLLLRSFLPLLRSVCRKARLSAMEKYCASKRGGGADCLTLTGRKS